MAYAGIVRALKISFPTEFIVKGTPSRIEKEGPPILRSCGLKHTTDMADDFVPDVANLICWYCPLTILHRMGLSIDWNKAQVGATLPKES